MEGYIDNNLNFFEEYLFHHQDDQLEDSDFFQDNDLLDPFEFVPVNPQSPKYCSNQNQSLIAAIQRATQQRKKVVFDPCSAKIAGGLIAFKLQDQVYEDRSPKVTLQAAQDILIQNEEANEEAVLMNKLREQIQEEITKFSSENSYMTFACQGQYLFRLKRLPQNNFGGIEPVPEDGEGELMANSSFKDLPKRSRVSIRKGVNVQHAKQAAAGAGSRQSIKLNQDSQVEGSKQAALESKQAELDCNEEEEKDDHKQILGINSNEAGDPNQLPGASNHSPLIKVEPLGFIQEDPIGEAALIAPDPNFSEQVVESHLNIALSSYLSFTVTQKLHQIMMSNPSRSDSHFAQSSNLVQKDYHCFILQKRFPLQDSNQSENQRQRNLMKPTAQRRGRILVRSYAFLTELEGDFLEWERAVSSYVVQHSKVDDAYTIIDKLGKGSFGYVVLAQPKHVKYPKFESDFNKESKRKIGGSIIVEERSGEEEEEEKAGAGRIAQNRFLKSHVLQEGEQEAPGGGEGGNNLEGQEEAKEAESKDQLMTQDKVALKILEKDKFALYENGLQSLIGEIKAHWILEQCEGVLKILAIYDNDGFVVLVLEYQSKGSLMETLRNQKKFTEVEVRIIMEQILLVLDFFQKKRIVHRDIKPDNILINQIRDKGKNYEVKVADLGLAVQTPNDDKLYQKCGTPGYIAPEIFSCKKENMSGYSYKADMFSAASLFFNLLTGYYIFNGNTMEELIICNRMCQTERILPYIQQFSSECQSLLLAMLQRDPQQRPTAAEALKHQWFQQDEAILQELLDLNKLVCTIDVVNPNTLNYQSNMQQQFQFNRPQTHKSDMSIDRAAPRYKQSYILESFLLGNNYFMLQGGGPSTPTPLNANLLAAPALPRPQPISRLSKIGLSPMRSNVSQIFRRNNNNNNIRDRPQRGRKFSNLSGRKESNDSAKCIGGPIEQPSYCNRNNSRMNNSSMGSPFLKNASYFEALRNASFVRDGQQPYSSQNKDNNSQNSKQLPQGQQNDSTEKIEYNQQVRVFSQFRKKDGSAAPASPLIQGQKKQLAFKDQQQSKKDDQESLKQKPKDDDDEGSIDGHNEQDQENSKGDPPRQMMYVTIEKPDQEEEKIPQGGVQGNSRRSKNQPASQVSAFSNQFSAAVNAGKFKPNQPLPPASNDQNQFYCTPTPKPRKSAFFGQAVSEVSSVLEGSKNTIKQEESAQLHAPNSSQQQNQNEQRRRSTNKVIVIVDKNNLTARKQSTFRKHRGGEMLGVASNQRQMEGAAQNSQANDPIIITFQNCNQPEASKEENSLLAASPSQNVPSQAQPEERANSGLNVSIQGNKRKVKGNIEPPSMASVAPMDVSVSQINGGGPSNAGLPQPSPNQLNQSHRMVSFGGRNAARPSLYRGPANQDQSHQQLPQAASVDQQAQPSSGEQPAQLNQDTSQQQPIQLSPPNGIHLLMRPSRVIIEEEEEEKKDPIMENDEEPPSSQPLEVKNADNAEDSDCLDCEQIEVGDDDDEGDDCHFGESEKALVSLPPDASRVVSIYGKKFNPKEMLRSSRQHSERNMPIPRHRASSSSFIHDIPSNSHFRDPIQYKCQEGLPMRMSRLNKPQAYRIFK